MSKNINWVEYRGIYMVGLHIRKRPPVEVGDLLGEIWPKETISHSVARKIIELAGTRKLHADVMKQWKDKVGLGSRALAYRVLRELRRIGMVRRIRGGEYVLSKEFSLYLRNRAELWDRYVDSWKGGEE